MTISAFRSGETASYWSSDPYDEKLTHEADHLLFNFSMPSKGGGVTVVKLQVSSESFEAVAKAVSDANWEVAGRAFASTDSAGFIVHAMMEADEEGTVRAMGSVLLRSKDRAVAACGTILLDKVGGGRTSDSN